MEIRRLTAGDYEDVAELWSRAKLPIKRKGRDSKTAITAQMKVNPDFFLGAYEGRSLVGVTIVSCEGRKGWINRLAVSPEHRCLGIAKALISASEEILRKRGVRIFCALIEDDNAASKALFRKCGYAEHRDIIYFNKRDSEEV